MFKVIMLTSLFTFIIYTFFFCSTNISKPHTRVPFSLFLLEEWLVMLFVVYSPY